MRSWLYVDDQIWLTGRRLDGRCANLLGWRLKCAGRRLDGRCVNLLEWRLRRAGKRLALRIADFTSGNVSVRCRRSHGSHSRSQHGRVTDLVCIVRSVKYKLGRRGKFRR